MTGKEFSTLVCRYILFNFESRSIRLYREVKIGKSIIGKDRIVDILLVDSQNNKGLAIECKYQSTQGTADEKIPYALNDLRAMRMPGCLVYAGDGFSTGILHMLRASDMAAFCLPVPTSLARTDETKELDHVLAMEFAWWDILADERKRYELELSVVKSNK